VFLFHFLLKTVIQKGIFAFGAFQALNGEASAPAPFGISV